MPHLQNKNIGLVGWLFSLCTSSSTNILVLMLLLFIIEVRATWWMGLDQQEIFLFAIHTIIGIIQHIESFCSRWTLWRLSFNSDRRILYFCSLGFFFVTHISHWRAKDFKKMVDFPQRMNHEFGFWKLHRFRMMWREFSSLGTKACQ